MKLADWLSQLDENGKRLRRRRVFAAKIGVSASMVTEYCRSGAWPSAAIMQKITDETGGEVTANDFVEHAAEKAAQHAGTAG